MSPSGQPLPQGVLREAADSCGLGTFLAVKLARGGGLKLVATLGALGHRVCAGEADPPPGTTNEGCAAYNVLISSRPVHCVFLSSWQDGVVAAVCSKLRVLGGVAWSGFWEVERAWRARGGRACAGLAKKQKMQGTLGEAADSKSSIRSQIISICTRRRSPPNGYGETRPRQGRMLLPPASSDDLWGGTVYPDPDASEAPAGCRVLKPRRGRAGFDAYSDSVTRVYRSVVGLVKQVLGPTRCCSPSEICKCIEDCAVQHLGGAIVAGRDKEGGKTDRPLSLAPSRSAEIRPHALAAGRGHAGGTTAYARLVGPHAIAEAVRRVSAGDVIAALEKRDSSIRLRGALLDRFPRKPHPEAGTKCNVYLDCVLTDLATYYPELLEPTCALLESVPRRALFEDQVAASVVFAASYTGAAPYCSVLALCLAGVSYPMVLKSLTDILKASGSNTRLEWAQLCELQCLLGRGAADMDLRSDALSRVEPGRGNAVVCDSRRLAEAIDCVLLEELGSSSLTCDTLEHHWDRRFEWCVAGSHSAVTNKDCGFPDVPVVGPAGIRVTRRIAMECTAFSPLQDWDGTTKVSVVPKLEHGKTRAIYSCNTISYSCFSRVLRPAERKWAGRRVIVDPGAGGSYGMFRRIRSAWPNTLPVALMIDYADFNSQHTLESQKLVISALLDRFPGVTEAEKDVLVSSFDRMHLYLKGEALGQVRRSLMSGHRGTSFINSVLNAAYIRMVVGEEVYAGVQSFHVGDDVLMFCKDVDQAYSIVDAMRSAGFQLQASKQSVGRAGFEFLRMAGTRSSAHGYLARAVASCVSGNWTTEWREQPVAGLHTAVQTARSIINRAANVDAWKLLVSSARAHTNLPVEALEDVLSGKVAVGNGPCYRDDGRFESREVLEVCDDSEANLRMIPYRALPREATRDYFQRGRSDLEARAMRLVGFQPWGAALRASYGDLAVISRGLAPPSPEAQPVRTKSVSLGGRTLFTKRGEVLLDHELDKDVMRGSLAQYPVISLLQHVLTDPQLAELLRAGGYSFEPGKERIAAFGGVREGATVRGWLPYSDAAALGARALVGTVRVMWPLYL